MNTNVSKVNSAVPTCAICFESFEKEESANVTGLECLHVFHRRCIIQWFNEPNAHGPRCPTCKTAASQELIVSLFPDRVYQPSQHLHRHAVNPGHQDDPFRRRGIDLPLSSDARALVTISGDTDLSRFWQRLSEESATPIPRLRNYGQRLSTPPVQLRNSTTRPSSALDAAVHSAIMIRRNPDLQRLEDLVRRYPSLSTPPVQLRHYTRPGSVLDADVHRVAMTRHRENPDRQRPSNEDLVRLALIIQMLVLFPMLRTVD